MQIEKKKKNYFEPTGWWMSLRFKFFIYIFNILYQKLFDKVLNCRFFTIAVVFQVC